MMSDVHNMSFLLPRIGCAGEEGKDTQVHQDKAGNVLWQLHGRTVR